MKIGLDQMEMKMTTYSELCAAQAEQDTALRSYVVKTQSQIRAFCEGYAKAIHAPECSYKSDDGAMRPYIRAMRVNRQTDKLEECDDFRFVREFGEDRVAWFGIAISLEPASDNARKAVYVYRIGMEWIENGMKITIPEVGKNVVAVRDGDAVDYTEVYAVVNLALLSAINRRFIP